MIPSLNLKGKFLQFDSPKIMGIVNITPDSFYTQGRNSSIPKMLDMVTQMLDDGASILDIGGQSTRPGSEKVGAIEEIRRVIPAIEAILSKFPDTILSIDTYYADVAKAAVESGALIVNDISAGKMDLKMLQTISDLQVSYIIMHMQGTPQNMQQNPKYTNIVTEVFDFLLERIIACKALEIQDVVIDLGFGFGKTITDNYRLFNQIESFKILEKPILVGISRKSMIYKSLEIEAEQALNGTTALHMAALMKGAQLLRVHDVKAVNETIKLFNILKNSTQKNSLLV